MSKVTTKLQVSIPKVLADRHGIAPGDEVRWEEAGEALRMLPERLAKPAAGQLDRAERLRLFDEATRRQQQRQAGHRAGGEQARGWTRDELYGRGRPR